MTQQEILDYNKRCAELLNLKKWIDSNEHIGFHVNPKVLNAQQEGDGSSPWAVLFSELKFHSDWNWIMEVVETIEKLRVLLPEKYKKGFLKNSTHGNIIINSDYDPREEFEGWSSSCSIELEQPFIYSSLNHEPKRFDSKKEAVVQAINQFLIWYNEHTSKLPNS
jgi:hypothetical protein